MPKCNRYYAKWQVLVPNFCKYRANFTRKENQIKIQNVSQKKSKNYIEPEPYIMPKCKLTWRVFRHTFTRTVSIKAERFSNVQEWDLPLQSPTNQSLPHVGSYNAGSEQSITWNGRLEPMNLAIFLTSNNVSSAVYCPVTTACQLNSINLRFRISVLQTAFISAAHIASSDLPPLRVCVCGTSE